MAQLTISLADQKTNFSPGQIISGRAEWDLDQGSSAVEIRLVWFTDGVGTIDGGLVATINCSPLSRGNQSFEFTLPQGPYSFSGTYISLTWALELVVLPKEEVEALEFVLSPTGEEIDLTRTTYLAS